MSKTTLPAIRKRRIYVSHPLRGSCKNDELQYVTVRNRHNVSEICRRVLREHENILILSPIHAFGFLSPYGDQTSALSQCEALLELADELWVYGDWRNSEGCQLEVMWAETRKIPVKYIDFQNACMTRASGADR